MGRKLEHRRSAALAGATERRDYLATNLEVRSGKKDDLTLVGRPIVYNSPYGVTDRYGSFVETVRAGCVSHLLAAGTLRTILLVNHDSTSLPLARFPTTLKFQDGAQGLDFTATLDPRMQVARDLAFSVERGDLDKMSIGFTVAQPNGDRWSQDESEREIVRFGDLIDVSAVSFPCSPSTSISVAQRSALKRTRPTDDLARELSRLRFEQMNRDIARIRSERADVESRCQALQDFLASAAQEVA